MELEKFTMAFAELLEETNVSDIIADTKFRDIEEWSSLTAMSVIAMVDEKYHIKLKGNDIKNSITIKDIFNIINIRK